MTQPGIGSMALWLMLLLGAYHGINPGMGWLFAFALGMQERKGSAVARALVPIALGHALAIGSVALALILFDGGLRTRFQTFRSALAPALVLATVGVLLTAALTAPVPKYLLTELPLLSTLKQGTIDAFALSSPTSDVAVRDLGAAYLIDIRRRRHHSLMTSFTSPSQQARCSSQSVRRQRPGALARCGARHLGVQGMAVCLKSQWSRASATSAMGHVLPSRMR